MNEKTLKITWLSSPGHVLTVPAPRPHAPITNSTLNTAEPKMVPIPMSPFVMKTPMIRKQNLSLNLFEGVESHLLKKSASYQNCKSFLESLVRMCITFELIWKFVSNP